MTMTTTSPIVLLDIDGCTNAFRATNPLPPHKYVAEVGGYQLVLDTRHPEWIADIATRAEVKFATMWQRHAPTHYAAVAGYGHDWDFIPFDDLAESTYIGRTGDGIVGYKWPGILAEAASGRPLVYVDDDMDPAHHQWAEKRNETVPTLFIQPDPRYGITSRQYRAIIAFLDRLAEPALAASQSAPSGSTAAGVGAPV